MEDDFLSLSKIYIAISVEDDKDIDNDSKIELVYAIIDECFDVDTKQQDEKIFRKPEYTNECFIKLLKFCGTKDFKQSPIILIVFCDYFNIGYSETYKMLHEKLQKLITIQSRQYISKDVYLKHSRRQNGGVRITTIDQL